MENPAEKHPDSAGRVRHIVWDWNGTLLDDLRAAVSAFNSLLRARSLPETDAAAYRAEFGFPARGMYEKHGFDLAHEDWDALARDFHAALRGDPSLKLQDGAREALETAKARGIGQSVLSALRQDFLECDLRRFGIDGFFENVCGSDDLDGAEKTARGRILAKSLALPPDEMVLVGDTLHDAEVAARCGMRCILVSCGHQNRERLLGAGAPVADDPLEAVLAAAELRRAAATGNP